MSDLINRSALYEKAAKLEEDARTRYFDTPPESPARQVHMAELTGITSVKHMIYDAPAVDAVPVVHGHWYFTEYEYFDCSACGAAYYNGCESSKEARQMLELGNAFNFCPNCGAKMDGDGKI